MAATAVILNFHRFKYSPSNICVLFLHDFNIQCARATSALAELLV